MTQSFRIHIEKFVGKFSEQEWTSILSFYNLMEVDKKEILQEMNTPCNRIYFVIQGCLRSFFVKSNGVEQTTDFAIENWWITDNLAFEQKQDSAFTIQAVEKTSVFYITYDNLQQLMAKHSVMQRYYRLVYQRAYGAAQYRIKYLYEYSREELYFHFEECFPEFIQRIPQYLIASYLGFSPEYLSEIKKKRVS